MKPRNPTRKKPEDLVRMKARGERIAVLTGYDANDATLLDNSRIDVILVGDSIGNVRLGYPDTTYVTMDDMIKAVTSVAEARQSALVIADMPIHSYGTAKQGIGNAKRLIACKADAVKIEGGVEVKEIVKAIVTSKIPVMGHIAHTPQTDKKHVVEGRNEDEAKNLLEDAIALEMAGAFSIVIELADSSVAKRITEALSIPTIGIGAGPHTDGQVLVLDDLLGWTDFSKFPQGRPPKFLGVGWDRRNPESTVKEYIQKVKAKAYPTELESYQVYNKG
jgi:3-methyl-2-oxobutanoate hydroxymethyltransferase